jgi:hypothetical protein
MSRALPAKNTEEVQCHLLHLLHERKLARSSVNQYACAYRFLYCAVLGFVGFDGQAFQIPLAPAPQRLPEILPREELVRLFAAACHLKSRTVLMLGGPAGMLRCLSRYTHRPAIGNERLLGIEDDKVRIGVRADDTGGKRTIALDGVQFIGRLLQHVLPPGFKRVRHYGLLAPALTWIARAVLPPACRAPP